MDTRKIPVFCYWNGCIKDGPDGPFYEGSTPRVIRVESKTDLSTLLNDLHRVTGLEKGKFKIDVIGRYPCIVQQPMVKYMRLPIVDDSSLETMLEVPSYHPSVTNVELYLDVKPVSHRSPAGNNQTRKRSRQNDANVDAESNNNGWLEEENSTDDVNCGDKEAAQKDSKKKKQDPSVSKQLIFSSSWLIERELYVGMHFRDQEKLKKAVKLYSDLRQRDYDVYDYGRGNIHFRCKKICGWDLKVAKTNGDGLEITEYRGPHTCKPSRVGSDFLAGEIQYLIKAQPSLSIAELNKWVKEEFGYTVSGENMWDAKMKAVTAILGDLEKSFTVLPKLMAALSSSNNMVMDWQYDLSPDPKDASFRSVFWAFQQSIKGFPHLRPLIIVDTVDLSGKYGGKLLVAAGVDAETQIFPLAFAIITQKSLAADSWRWFFGCIRKKVTQREGLCLITSPDPDIVAVLNEPECHQWAQHRFCLSYLCLKFYDVFRNNLMTEFVHKAGATKHRSTFDYYLKKIEKMNPGARKWLDKTPPHKWSLAHDNGGIRFGVMNANTIFATYSFINKARDLPITTCILLIFDHVAERFKSRREHHEESLKNRGDKFAKHVMKLLEEYKVASRTHDVLPLKPTGVRFQVTDVKQDGHIRYVVHLTERACTCGILQLYKYPCSHVLAVCRRINNDHLQYVNDCFSTDCYLGTYVADFNPLPGVSDWPEASEVPRLFPPGSRPPSFFRSVPIAPPRNNSAQASKLATSRKGSTGKKKA